ncbi:MAG: methylglyoxal synthase [Bacteroidales bacterium]|nr:methylglyoxal synthase [Bacteroidales bacterium]
MKTLNIALVAHDARKKEFMEWIASKYEILAPHKLYATGTTGRMIQELEVPAEDGFVADRPLANNVTRLLSGPLGGDQQIGAMIAEGKIDLLIFFCDNLIVQGHQTDVSALTRLASLYNVAFATNRTTADLLLSSPLLYDEGYEMLLPECIARYASRKVE